MTSNARALAAKVLMRLQEQRVTLRSLLKTCDPHAEKAMVQALCYGVCRYYAVLDFFTKRYLKKPIKDPLIRSLLLLGMYQLLWFGTRDHAAINETVAAAAVLRKPWAKGLLNAVLHRVADERDDLMTEYHETAWQQFTPWLLQIIQRSWPNAWPDILRAYRCHPPLSLRVNRQLQARQAYLDQLTQQGIAAFPIALAPQAIYLAEPRDVHTIPGFHEGEVSVQDAAAQLVSECLSLQDDDYLLDACAAPGGKTGAILEANDSLQVLAIDVLPDRVQQVRDNLARIPNSQLRCQIRCADATDPLRWWDGRLFSKILLDAPCTATGIIKRHPDVALLRQPDELPQLTTLQAHLLASLWPLLLPGGQLLYVTCSILSEENDDIIAAFLQTNSDAVLPSWSVSWGQVSSYGRQLLPTQYWDGLYFSVLEKPVE